MQASQRFAGVGDRGVKAVRAGYRAGIPHLAAAFAIEWRLVGQQNDRIAAFGGLDFSHHP